MTTTPTICISKREQYMLAACLSLTASTKGAVEERALGLAFAEFGLLEVLPELDNLNLLKLPTHLEEISAPSEASVRFVLDVLNDPNKPKNPIHAIVLRPLADRLKVG